MKPKGSSVFAFLADSGSANTKGSTLSTTKCRLNLPADFAAPSP
ncbi:TPA: hypothetical protein ACJ3GQ_001467 [Neisseria meningitidis]